MASMSDSARKRKRESTNTNNGKDGDLDRSNEENEAFPLNLKRFFDSSMFTDFTIITTDHEFHVHKVVICAQSEYFSLMFNADWKEAEKNEIELKEDNSRAIKAMIHFMYGFRNELSGGEDVSQTLLSAQVYGVAEKYGVVKLKQRAKIKFENAVRKSWHMDDFPKVVEEVYVSTHSTVRDLRDELVKVTQKNIGALMKKKEFQLVLEENAGFAADMVRILAEKHSGSRNFKKYKCPNCFGIWESKVISDVRNIFCMYCKHLRREWSTCAVQDGETNP